MCSIVYCWISTFDSVYICDLNTVSVFGCFSERDLGKLAVNDDLRMLLDFLDR